jgi:hypothetical protein
MKKSSLLWLVLLALGGSLAFTSCTKDDDDQAGQAVLGLEFEYLVNGEAFDTARVYQINGTAVKFSIAQFYVGGIAVADLSGRETVMEGKYLLVKPGSGLQEAGTMPPGHAHELRFFIGVGPEENNQSESDFTSRKANDPLAIQFPAMHWSWLTGYRFIRVDGRVDTNGDGVLDESLAFHIGTDPFLTQLEFTTHQDLKEGMNPIHFKFDLAKLFDNIDLSKDYVTHTGNNPELAERFRANLVKAFQYGQ